MMNPSASQDLWQSHGYRRGRPQFADSQVFAPRLSTITPVWIHALVCSLQNISCFMHPVNYRQDHGLPDCLLARLQD